MTRRTTFLAWILIAGVVVGNGMAVRAADPTLDFLEALREEGWHDTALEAIDALEKSRRDSAAVTSTLAYQRGLTLAGLARQERSATKRRTALTEAGQALSRFAAEQPKSSAAVDALREAANLHAEVAYSALAARGKLPPQATAQREDLTVSAQAALAAAQAAAEEVVRLAESRMSSLPKPTSPESTPDVASDREQLKLRRQEARFLVAKLMLEAAKTEPPESEARSKQLAAAAAAFQALFVEYENSLVGFYGRLYEGRCYQEAGEYDRAMPCFRDLLEVNTNNASFRALMAQALRSRVETLMAQGKIDDAIEDGRRWLAESRPNERTQPDWLGVSYRLAEALLAHRDRLPPSDSQVSKVTSEARLLLRETAQRPNDFQQEARLTLSSLGTADGREVEYREFDDAFAAAKMALELRNSSRLAAQLAKSNNPSAVDELRKQADENNALAIDRFETALRLASSTTPTEKLNEARYYLSVLYWDAGRVAESAVLGNFLTSRYGDGPFGQRASQVALAAMERLYLDARNENSSSAAGARQRLAELAERIAAEYPKSAHASAAVSLLINVALADQRVDQAEALLARLSGSGRAAAQLSLGSALWRQHLQEKTAGEKPPGEIDGLRVRAGELLRQGFDGARGADPSPATATGALYLAQILLASGDAAAAINVLEDDTLGPLTLVREQSPAASRPEYVDSTLRSALRAYLSIRPPQRADAQEVMQALEAEASGDEELTRTLLSIAAQLQQSIQELVASGKQADAAGLAAALQDVVGRIRKQGGTSDWTMQNRLALVNLQMGELLSGDLRRESIEQAQQAYADILESAKKNPNFAPSADSLLAVRKRLADCQRGLGNYQKALDQYAAILKQKPSMLQLQKAAAETLLQQGENKKDVGALNLSIFGTMKQADGKNLIWGWVRLAKVADYAKRKAEAAESEAVARQYEDLFFEARYQTAKARFTMAEVGPPIKRQENLQKAKRSITSMKSLYPDLGGAKWKAAFEKLLKKIDEPNP